MVLVLFAILSWMAAIFFSASAAFLASRSAPDNARRRLDSLRLRAACPRFLRAAALASLAVFWALARSLLRPAFFFSSWAISDRSVSPRAIGLPPVLLPQSFRRH